MSGAEPTGPDAGTVEVLRRVKTTEAEWESKLTAARATSEQALAEAHAGAEASIKAVLSELEARRSHDLEAAVAAADSEAHEIVKTGESAAAKARSGAGKKVTGRKDEIVRAVLGEFASP